MLAVVVEGKMEALLVQVVQVEERLGRPPLVKSMALQILGAVVVAVVVILILISGGQTAAPVS